MILEVLFLEVLAVMVSEVHACVPTYQNMYIKMCAIFVYQFHLNKALKTSSQFTIFECAWETDPHTDLWDLSGCSHI